MYTSRHEGIPMSQPCSRDRSLQSEHPGLCSEHASQDNGDVWVMQPGFKDHLEQTVLPLL
jgi:hypothetical protein